MSDSSSNQPVTRSTFPPPPPFWRLYPAETPAALLSPSSTPLASSSSSLPTAFGLPIFIPPPLPTSPYVKFQQLHDPQPPSSPPLPAGVPRLYSVGDDGAIDFPAALSALLASLLSTYLSLLSCLATAPPPPSSTALTSALSSLSHHFLNITHLLSLLRRHQARQALIVLLRRQATQRRSRTDALKQRVREAKATLAGYGCEWEESSTDVAPTSRSRNSERLSKAEEKYEGMKQEEEEEEQKDEDTVKQEVKDTEEDEAASAESTALRLLELIESIVDPGD